MNSTMSLSEKDGTGRGHRRAPSILHISSKGTKRILYFQCKGNQF
jgi:hypothetical protein